MAQILVRNVEKGVVRRLKERARRRGRSLQSEVKEILVRAATAPELDMEAARRLALRIQKLTPRRPRKESTRIIREGRHSRGNPNRWR